VGEGSFLSTRLRNDLYVWAIPGDLIGKEDTEKYRRISQFPGLIRNESQTAESVQRLGCISKEGFFISAFPGVISE
jgi:hypothetical protein